MKATTAMNNLNKVAKQNRVKGTAAYRMVMHALSTDCKVIRPCTISGTGRHIKNVDYTSQVCRLLTDAKIKFKLTNDAPRGGLTGNKITLTHIKG